MKSQKTFYLSSMESVRLAGVRRCHVKTVFYFDTGKPILLVTISPKIMTSDFDNLSDIDEILLVSRHEGDNILKIQEFPFFVYVCTPKEKDVLHKNNISSDKLEILAWGEIYGSETDAANNKIG